jgi:hypothetical protein
MKCNTLHWGEKWNRTKMFIFIHLILMCKRKILSWWPQNIHNETENVRFYTDENVWNIGKFHMK